LVREDFQTDGAILGNNYCDENLCFRATERRRLVIDTVGNEKWYGGRGRGRREEKKKRRSIRYRAVLRDGGIEPCTIERQEKDKADKGDLRGYTPATGSYHLV
jgi:hypothetical protein